MHKIALILITVFLNGCSSIPFEESKVEVLALNKEISNKDINNKDFNNYLLSNKFRLTGPLDGVMHFFELLFVELTKLPTRQWSSDSSVREINP